MDWPCLSCLVRSTCVSRYSSYFSDKHRCNHIETLVMFLNCIIDMANKCELVSTYILEELIKSSKSINKLNLLNIKYSRICITDYSINYSSTPHAIMHFLSYWLSSKNTNIREFLLNNTEIYPSYILDFNIELFTPIFHDFLKIYKDISFPRKCDIDPMAYVTPGFFLVSQEIRKPFMNFYAYMISSSTPIRSLYDLTIITPDSYKTPSLKEMIKKWIK